MRWGGGGGYSILELPNTWEGKISMLLVVGVWIFSGTTHLGLNIPNPRTHPSTSFLSRNSLAILGLICQIPNKKNISFLSGSVKKRRWEGRFIFSFVIFLFHSG